MIHGQAVDRTNRVALLVLGLILTAVGSYALVRGLGVMGDGRAADSVAGTLLGLIPDPEWRWLPAMVGSLALLLAILGLRWVTAQVKFPPRTSTVTVEETDRGTTQVRGSAVSHAVSTQLARIPGTGDARVRITSTPSGRRADIRLEIIDRADVAGIIESAEAALSQASRLTGLGDVTASIRLVPVADRRVH